MIQQKDCQYLDCLGRGIKIHIGRLLLFVMVILELFIEVLVLFVRHLFFVHMVHSSAASPWNRDKVVVEKERFRKKTKGETRVDYEKPEGDKKRERGDKRVLGNIRGWCVDCGF